MKTLAFIPARGGSKGIPRKNLASLAGKPLLQWSVEAARACPEVNRIFLSSDDPEIINFGQLLGLDSDYRRPDVLASDCASIVDVVLHALDWLETCGEHFDSVLLLQPTSPLRTSDDITAALKQFSGSSAATLVSVHRMREHPFECIHGDPTAWCWLARPEFPTWGRQAYQGDFYFINGAIYIVTVDFLRRERRFVEDGKAVLYVMPAERGIDIDDYDQLQLAEWRLTKDK